MDDHQRGQAGRAVGHLCDCSDTDVGRGQRYDLHQERHGELVSAAACCGSAASQGDDVPRLTVCSSHLTPRAALRAISARLTLILSLLVQCGAPANATGYIFPGQFNSALMTGLPSSTKIYYKVGDPVRCALLLAPAAVCSLSCILRAAQLPEA